MNINMAHATIGQY